MLGLHKRTGMTNTNIHNLPKKLLSNFSHCLRWEKNRLSLGCFLYINTSHTNICNVGFWCLPTADAINPFIASFPDDITVSVPFGTPSTPVDWQEPTAFDNSGTVIPTKTREPGSSFPTGETTTVTYTFSDPAGNSVLRSFTVTVVELRKSEVFNYERYNWQI